MRFDIRTVLFVIFFIDSIELSQSRYNNYPRFFDLGIWSDCPKTVIDIGEVSRRSGFGRGIIRDASF